MSRLPWKQPLLGEQHLSKSARLKELFASWEQRDLASEDPFVYSLADNLQLVAGYSRTQPDDGLVVWMPDFDEVEQGENLSGATVKDTLGRTGEAISRGGP